MKNYKIYVALSLLALIFTISCNKATAPYLALTDSKANASVYIAKSGSTTQNLTIFPFVDTARTLTFAASFGAVGLPLNNIPVTFAFDQRAFDSLNVARTNAGLPLYLPFPSDGYSTSSLTATIPSGGLTSNIITLSYFSKKFDATKDYLLPISITNANGYKIGTNKTIFIIAPKVSETLATKTGWSATADSEELVGELPSGSANCAIDGNIATYWHTQYIGLQPNFPHWIDVDMKASIYVTRVDLAPRQNNINGFSSFNLDGSNDNLVWTSLGTGLTFDPTNKSFQTYRITPGFYRYIRVSPTAPRVGIVTANTHLAEINIYRF